MQKSKKSGYNKIKRKESSSPDSQSPHQSNSNNPSPKNDDEDQKPPPDTGNGDGSIKNRSSGKPKFQRISSVSSSNPSSAKRNFSIRRSSSVSERYCRIHDQHLVIASPYLDGDKVEGRDDESSYDSVQY